MDKNIYNETSLSAPIVNLLGKVTNLYVDSFDPLCSLFVRTLFCCDMLLRFVKKYLTRSKYNHYISKQKSTVENIVYFFRQM